MSQNCECKCGKPIMEIPVCGLLNLVPSGCGQPGIGTGSSNLPNLQFGVETKADRLYMGKQVYTQMFDYGPGPNVAVTSLKNIPHNIPDVEWIHVDHTYSFLVLPNNAGVYSPSAADSAVIVTDKNVGISYNGDATSYDYKICLVYTKKSDPAIA